MYTSLGHMGEKIKRLKQGRFQKLFRVINLGFAFLPACAHCQSLKVCHGSALPNQSLIFQVPITLRPNNLKTNTQPTQHQIRSKCSNIKKKTRNLI